MNEKQNRNSKDRNRTEKAKIEIPHVSEKHSIGTITRINPVQSTD